MKQWAVNFVPTNVARRAAGFEDPGAVNIHPTAILLDDHAPVVTNQFARIRSPQQGFKTVDRHFLMLGRWQGHVVEVGAETFSAIIKDLTQNAPDELVDFSIDELGTANKTMLREGAIFYWSVGYMDSSSGQRSRTSEINFQRRPRISEDDLDEARNWAIEMRRIFVSEEPKQGRP